LFPEIFPLLQFSRRRRIVAHALLMASTLGVAASADC